MQITSPGFKENARTALDDAPLQRALGNGSVLLVLFSKPSFAWFC